VSGQEEIHFDPRTGAHPISMGNIGLCVNFKLQPSLHMSVPMPEWCFLSAGQKSPRAELHQAPRSACRAESKKNSALHRQESDSEICLQTRTVWSRIPARGSWFVTVQKIIQNA